ncbi:GPI inositol deacylase [Perkinsus olseni]|uniref:GPI inositol-deacylase n=1 Tax=Perkinsus olseni TaxID=32597 RepID=A0A7J6LBT9_PEROL|nr:GPI inositol deacylase [Perkinsus olseni]
MRGDRYAWVPLSLADEHFVLRNSGAREYQYELKQFVQVHARTANDEHSGSNRTLEGLLSEIDGTVNVVLLLHGNRGTYGNFDEFAATMYRDWYPKGVLNRTVLLALDFYEEPNAFHPSVVEAQAELTRGLMAGVCTKGVRCALVGHSMGGVVAAIAVSKSTVDIVENVASLVTVSTPLKTHPAMLDVGWHRVYSKVSRGIRAVPVVSVTGGAADWQVPMEDTRVAGANGFQWALMPASDGVFAQGDHIAVMYSYEVLTYQVVPAVARALGWRSDTIIGADDDLKEWMLSMDRPARKLPLDQMLDVRGEMVVEVESSGSGGVRQLWDKNLLIDARTKGGAVLVLRRERPNARCPHVKVVDWDVGSHPRAEAPELCQGCSRLLVNESLVFPVGAKDLRLARVNNGGATWCISQPIGPDVKAILVPPGQGFVIGLTSAGVMELKSRSGYEQYEMGVRVDGDVPHFACLAGGHSILAAASSSNGRSVMAPSRPLGGRREEPSRSDTLVVISPVKDIGRVSVDYTTARVPTLMRMLLSDWPYIMGSLQFLLALQIMSILIGSPSSIPAPQGFIISPLPILCYTLLSTFMVPLLSSTGSTLSLMLMSILALTLHSGAYALLNASKGPRGRASFDRLSLGSFSSTSKRAVMKLALFVALYVMLLLVCPSIFGHLAALMIGFRVWRQSACEETRLGLLLLLQSFTVRSLQLLYTVMAILSRFVADRPHAMVGVNPLLPGVADWWAVLDGAATALLPLALALSMSAMVNNNVAKDAVLRLSSNLNRPQAGSGFWALPLYYLTLASQWESTSTIANSTSSPTLLPSGDPSEPRHAEVTGASVIIMGVAVILSAGCIYAVLRMGRAGRQEAAPTAGTSDGAMLVASCASCGREQYMPRIETAVAFTCFECRRANPVPWVAPHPVEQTGPLMEYEFTRVNNTFFRVSGQREHNASENPIIITPLAPIMVGRPAEEENVDVPSCTICMVDYREGGEKWKFSEEFSEDAPGDSVVLPCAHGGFCITCISAIKQSGRPYCPQCRKLIDRAVRLEEISDRVAKAGEDLGVLSGRFIVGPAGVSERFVRKGPAIIVLGRLRLRPLSGIKRGTRAEEDGDPHSSAASSSTKRSVSSMATAPDVAPLTKLYDLQKRRQRARESRRMMAASSYPSTATSPYYPASEYGGGSSYSVISYPRGATPEGSAITSRSSYAPVLTPSPTSRSEMRSMYSPEYSGPVMLPRVGVPLPPEISGRYYYGMTEELAAPPPPQNVKAFAPPYRETVVAGITDGIAEEPEPSRVPPSIAKELSAPRKW